MNADSGQIYRMPDEIRAAEARKEPLIYGDESVLTNIQPLILNRAQRRMAARMRARQERKR